MTGERPAVLVYGNCQAEFLHLLLRQMPSFADRFDFILATNNVDVSLSVVNLDGAERAVLLWEQYEQRPSHPVRDEVLRRLSPDCRIVRFPMLSLNALWPFRMRDPRNRVEPEYPYGRYPWGDRIVTEIVQLNLPVEEAFARYMERSEEAMPNLERFIVLDKSQAQHRDEACDVKMADYVFDRLQTTYQFWTHGDLSIGVLGELLRRAIGQSEAVLGPLDEAVLADVERACALFEGQGDLQLPMHPLVIERLGLEFADETTRYRWYGNRWTFEEFIKRLLVFDTAW